MLGWRPTETAVHLGTSVAAANVLRVDGARIAEITTFGYAMLPALGLPSILSSA